MGGLPRRRGGVSTLSRKYRLCWLGLPRRRGGVSIAQETA